MLEHIIHKNFSRAAASYWAHAKVQHEIGNRLLSRLDLMKIQPKVILDLGAGVGVFSRALNKRYKQAELLSMDISHAMLSNIRRGIRFRPRKVVADMTTIPLQDGSVDIVFANQVIHWASDSRQVLSEIARVLSPEGLLLFSTLGPDTFKEVNEAWLKIDSNYRGHQFTDMHLWGDAMMKSGFQLPVVDMEKITVRYRAAKDFIKDLRAQGVQHGPKSGFKGLVTPRRWRQFEEALEVYRDKDGLLPMTYEVVYGQAWGRQQISSNEHGTSVKDLLSSYRGK